MSDFAPSLIFLFPLLFPPGLWGRFLMGGSQTQCYGLTDHLEKDTSDQR